MMVMQQVKYYTVTMLCNGEVWVVTTAQRNVEMALREGKKGFVEYLNRDAKPGTHPDNLYQFQDIETISCSLVGTR